MRAFTDGRSSNTIDQIWLVEHPPVYTLGRRGGNIDLQLAASADIVHSDRGGLITWHGPGQIILYWLADISRLKLSLRGMVQHLEQAVINLLAGLGVQAQARRDAPGVYLTDGAKIASLGLRLRKSYSYHGIALNVCNDLSPFAAIVPCGLDGIRMTSLRQLGLNLSPLQAGERLAQYLIEQLYKHQPE